MCLFPWQTMMLTTQSSMTSFGKILRCLMRTTTVFYSTSGEPSWILTIREGGSSRSCHRSGLSKILLKVGVIAVKLAYSGLSLISKVFKEVKQVHVAVNRVSSLSKEHVHCIHTNISNKPN